jgi:methylthioribose-1-phosphate isomerase
LNEPDFLESMNQKHDTIRAVNWIKDGLELLDQRLLPVQQKYLRFEDAQAVARAITDMVVRGAPAIGITAAYGVVLAVRERYVRSPATWKEDIAEDFRVLAASRPTAVNLFWALERMRACIDRLDQDPVPTVLSEARHIHEEDIAANRRMGELGAELIANASGVLTHCNTGSLATGGYGTALGVIRSAYAAGKIKQVFADETRPWLQGSRLTAWELVQDNIPVTMLADSAAAHTMKQGLVDWVIVGSDRIAANGDVANKIGTYSLAVNSRYHNVKMMVVAPTSTVDMNIASGQAIPIEERARDEVLKCGQNMVAAEGAGAWNPAFDITPAELIDAIVTEKGVVLQPNAEKMLAMMQNG